MKQIETKILVAIIAIILVVGTIMIFVKGLAFELRFQDSQKIEINIGKEINRQDIKEITDEVFDGQVVRIQLIEVYKDAVSITTTQITEEQKTQLVTRLNEKFGTETKADDIQIENVSHTRGRDILKPYIAPFIIGSIIILVYLMIRYNKLNCFKVLLQSIGILVMAQLVLLCIMAITRMPIGRFTIPTILTIYILSTYICTAKFEQDLDKKIVKENEN